MTNHPSLDRAPLGRSISTTLGLVDAQGRSQEPIFSQMTKLALETGSINLGQGAPGTPAHPVVAEAAKKYIDAGVNQYPPGQGHPDLLTALARHQRENYGIDTTIDNVLVTTGATEGLYASLVALAAPGSEVVVFEPYYDSYAAGILDAGASLKPVALSIADDGTTGYDSAELRAAVTDNTSVILVNSPHNPTGRVFTLGELTEILALAKEHDAWIITDEVYEHLVFDGIKHIPIASLPGADGRVVTISSAGKAFSVTGWKIGWVIADPDVRVAIQVIKQFTTFTTGAPFQPAIAEGLNAGYAVDEVRDSLAERRGVLLEALGKVHGLTVSAPEAGYFALVDVSGLTDLDAAAANDLIARKHGVVGIPVPGLCGPGSPVSQAYRSVIRYSFCKSPEDVAEAARRLGEVSPKTFLG